MKRQCLDDPAVKEAVAQPVTPRARLVVFWDYDTQWGADRSRSPGGPKDWGHLDFVWTERLLEIHAKYQWPACFAVVGSAALEGSRPYHDREQIRRIHEEGHEVASHSHRHEWLPGLGPRALAETLSSSRDALEQCIGGPVVTFVPPYNQPFDCAARLSFSLAERREAGRTRTDLTALCHALRTAGYRCCRVAYRTLLERLADRVFGPRFPGSALDQIAGVSCMRVWRSSGFDGVGDALPELLRRGHRLIVVHGHPHSIGEDGPQSARHLESLLEKAKQLREQGLMEPCLPRDLCGVRQPGREQALHTVAAR